MSKYKVGDKVVMEIMRVDDGVDLMNVGSCGCSWCIPASQIDRMSEPLSAYTEPLEAKIRRQAAEITRLLAENERLKPNYENFRAKGQNEAWELAGKIVSDIYHGGYNSDELKEIFGYSLYQNIWEDNTYPEAAAKVAEWEKAKEEIKVGDIVRLQEGSNNDLGILCKTSDEKYYTAVDKYGALYPLLEKEHFSKTGRHIDIYSFLKQIGEE